MIYKIPNTLDSLPHAVLNCFLWSAFPVLAGGGGDYDPAQDTAVPPSLQVYLKTPNRMGYPDTEQADKRTQLLPKVVTSLTKRLGWAQDGDGFSRNKFNIFFEEPCLHTLLVTYCVQNTPVNSTFAVNHMPAFGRWRYLRMKRRCWTCIKGWIDFVIPWTPSTTRLS